MDQVERPDASRNNVEERDDAINWSVCYELKSQMWSWILVFLLFPRLYVILEVGSYGLSQ